jgi:hypothetical protein
MCVRERERVLYVYIYSRDHTCMSKYERERVLYVYIYSREEAKIECTNSCAHYMHTYVSVYTCICVHTCVCIHECTKVSHVRPACLHTRVYTYACMHVQDCLSHQNRSASMLSHTCMHIHTWYIYKHTHTCICAT